MYIRIQDNSIRYRVSRNEASQLLEGKALLSSLALPPAHSLNYRIATSDNSSRFEFDSITNELLLSINHNELHKEIDGRPSKRGIMFCQSFSEESITVSLEIDLKKK